MPIEIYRRKDRPNWYVRGTVSGRSVNQSTGIPLRFKRQAKRRAAEIEASCIEDSLDRPRAERAFTDVAGRYRAGLSPFDQSLVERLEKHFAGLLVSDISQSDIDDAASTLYPRASAATKNRCVYTPMSAMMRRAAAEGYCRWGGLRRPRDRAIPRDRWLPPDDAWRLIECAEPYELKTLIVFMVYTGARIGEALALRWTDVDLVRRHVSLRQFKTRDRRGVPITEEVFEYLAGLPGSRAGNVFPWSDRTSIRRPWRRACAIAGIADFTPHDCRHTWATWMMKYSGCGLRYLQEAGGWRDVKSVVRYTHVSSEEVREAINRLPKRSETAPEKATKSAPSAASR